MLDPDAVTAGRRAQTKTPAATTTPDSFDYVPAHEVGSLIASANDLGREQQATEAERFALAIEASKVAEHGATITDPDQLVAIHQKLAAVSPAAAEKLLENADYTQPEVVGWLRERNQIAAVNAQLVREHQAAEAQGQAAFEEGVARMTHAADVSGVGFIDVLDAVDAAEENGLTLTAPQAGEVARSTQIAEARLAERGRRFDEWVRPAVVHGYAHAEAIEKQRAEYVKPNPKDISYRVGVASPDAVKAASDARQREMRQNLLGGVPTDLPLAERVATREAVASVKPSPKRVVSEWEKHSDHGTTW